MIVFVRIALSQSYEENTDLVSVLQIADGPREDSFSNSMSSEFPDREYFWTGGQYKCLGTAIRVKRVIFDINVSLHHSSLAPLSSTLRIVLVLSGSY